MFFTVVLIIIVLASPTYSSSAVISSIFVLEDTSGSSGNSVIGGSVDTAINSAGEAALESSSLSEDHRQKTIRKPFIDGAYSFHGGEIKRYSGDVVEIVSPIIELTAGGK